MLISKTEFNKDLLRSVKASATRWAHYGIELPGVKEMPFTLTKGQFEHLMSLFEDRKITLQWEKKLTYGKDWRGNTTCTVHITIKLPFDLWLATIPDGTYVEQCRELYKAPAAGNGTAGQQATP